MEIQLHTSSRARQLFLIAGLAVIYFVSARLSLFLAFDETNATPVWPPSGIAFAALLFFGVRIWPAIFIGAWCVNFYVFLSNMACDAGTALWVSSIIGTGNTMEAVLGYFMLRKLVPNLQFLEKTKYIFYFVFTVLFMCLASSFIGSLAVCAGSIAPWERFSTVWFTWWNGDIAGILVLTPLFWGWKESSNVKWRLSRLVELALLFAAILLIDDIIFAGWLIPVFPFDKTYLVIPVLLWVAFRFEQREVVTALGFSSAIAIWGTLSGTGPFASGTLNDSLLSLQAYISIISITVLSLKAAINERNKTEKKLLQAWIELEMQIKIRTDELFKSRQEVELYQARIEGILQVILEYSTLNFISQAPVSERGDELDAIAAGLNTFAEEMAALMEKEKYQMQNLKDSEERFRLMVENVKDYSIIMIDAEGNVASWNQGAEKIKGYIAQEIIGKHISAFYTPEEIERGEPEYNLKTAKEKGRFQQESWRVRKNGSRFWADVVYNALNDEHGNLKGFVKVTRDITERKLAEELVLQKTDELRRSNQELEQFAYVASHDLQEPLRIVTSFVQLLQKRYESQLDKNADEYIGFIVGATGRMRALINDLLAFSRVGARADPFVEVDLNKVLKTTLDNLKTSIMETNAQISYPELPVVKAERLQMEQLFQNLIGNSIKFRNEGSPEIEISYKEEREYFLFSVHDNGIGIPEQYAEKIFVLFQRLHARDKYSGTGMGLAICKKIVERHRGKIWVEPTTGPGATICFTIRKEI